jgi:hypothetical protein
MVDVNIRANNGLDLKGKKKKGAEKNGEEKNTNIKVWCKQVRSNWHCDYSSYILLLTQNEKCLMRKMIGQWRWLVGNNKCITQV